MTKLLVIMLPSGGLLAATTAAGSLGAVGSFGRWWLILALLSMSLIFSAVLSLEQLGRWKLPGCGAGGGCATLTAGPWGKIRGWPVSFLGAACFAALWAYQLAVGWRHPVPGLLVLAVSAGAVASLYFLGVMVAFRHFCPYCFIVHSGNLAAWILLASAPDWSWLTRRGIVGACIAAAVFVVTTILLASAQVVTKEVSTARHEGRFQQSVRRIRRHLHRSKRHPVLDPVAGRWWRGPQNAAIRLVVFSDYQCPDCRKTELQLHDALAGRCDAAVSYKHFPLSSECNPPVKSPGDHRHACRAARAAEAAGMLGGSEGFLRVHAWLFKRKAEFNDEQLAAMLPAMGFSDVDGFLNVMNGSEAAKRVKRDIAEGIALGVSGTPAVFVNGVRLEGATADRAISRLLEAVGRGANTRWAHANGR